jgi:hypothetical protein
LEHKNDVFGYDCIVVDEIWNIGDVIEDVSDAVGLAVLPFPTPLFSHSFLYHQTYPLFYLFLFLLLYSYSHLLF